MKTMYLDIKGLCTCAIGILILSPEDAWKDGAIQWRVKATKKPASFQDVVDEFNSIKEQDKYSNAPSFVWDTLTKLYLTDESIDKLVLGKLDIFERQLKGRAEFSSYENWPADAQLGLLSMSWAMGPKFHFPKFELACKANRWDLAASECRMDDSHNPGLVPRNVQNANLFKNAEAIERLGLERDKLMWRQG